MAARRLVLNGLTAEVGAGGQEPAARAGSPDSLEFYHELELYRQLLALPPPAPPARPAPGPSAPPAAPERRARTPDPTPTTRCHGTYSVPPVSSRQLALWIIKIKLL